MTHSPSVDLFGSYFPAWMLCLVAGIILTILCRFLLIRLRLEPEVGHLALIYPCLTVFFTSLLWLLLFR